MADYLTPPTIRKKKPDFWGGFATALAAEVKRRAAQKDAMEQYKAQQDMALAKQKELAQFNQPFEQQKAQDVFDVAQFGQRLTPDVVGSVAKPEELYGVGVPEGTYGPPTADAYKAGLGGAIAGMRRKAAEYKQNIVQTPEDLAKEQAKRDTESRRQAYNTLSAAQKHTFKMEEIGRRQSLANEAKGAGASPKIISGALAAANSAANSIRRAYGSEAEATDAHDRAFQSYIQTYASYGYELPKPPPPGTGGVEAPGGTAGTDTTKVTPSPIIDETGAAALVDEYKNPSTTPARREEIKKLLAAYKAQKR